MSGKPRTAVLICALCAALVVSQAVGQWRAPGNAPHDCEVVVMWEDGSIGPAFRRKDGWVDSVNWAGWPPPHPTKIIKWYPAWGECGVPIS